MTSGVNTVPLPLIPPTESITTSPTPTLGPTAGYARWPRFGIELNGTPVTSPIGVNITTNNYSEPSRFEATIALTNTEAETITNLPSISVQVYVSLDGYSSQTVFYGLIDTLEYDPIVGILTFSGRDLAGLFMDTPTQLAEQNYTSSQVVEKFVQQQSAYGVKGDITQTTGLIGRYYQPMDYDFRIWGGNTYRATNEWDFMLFLAQHEGFDLRVEGQTLYFGPATSDTAPAYQIVVGNDQGVVATNVERLRLVRSLTLAKDVKVTVMSWQSFVMRPVERSVQSSQPGSPSGGYGPVQNYIFNKPDLTPEQALATAKSLLKDITVRERIIEVDMPGELTLNPSSRVNLSGTNTSWDQLYYIDEITRSLSFGEGFKQHLRLKNHSSGTQTTVF